MCFNRYFKDNAGEKIRSMDVFSELEDTELRFKRTKKSDSEEVFTEEEATRIKEYLQDNLDTKNMVLLLVFYSGIRVIQHRSK